MRSGLSILIEETAGINKIDEPVSVGVPFPRGSVYDISKISLFDINNKLLPAQLLPLSFWPDKSLKWVLFDFHANVRASEKINYNVKYPETRDHRPDFHNSISVHKNKDQIIINTGKAEFLLDPGDSMPFKEIKTDGTGISDNIKTGFSFINHLGKKLSPVCKNISAETEGPLRTTFKITGQINDDGRLHSNLTLRVSFFAGTALIKMDITLQNPRRASHPKGFWDLGDEGSVYFKDFSLNVGMGKDRSAKIRWTVDSGQNFSETERKKLVIYQDSSGGANWDSPNHINRFGEMKNSFCGYRVYDNDELIAEGNRARPVVSLIGKDGFVSGAVKEFWQNFPKAIEADANDIILRIFPGQYKDIFELQAGEQKTHTIFLNFGKDYDGPRDINWIHDPLMPKLEPEWYADSKVFDYFTPLKGGEAEYNELVKPAINGENAFSNKNESIDEYGWRNFGDIYADHEVLYYKGAKPLISHYNNQYDVIYGTMLWFAKSGDTAWYRIADSLARHVIDVDIYHTERDKAAYNGGLFWHTIHYTNVATATHRSYTRKVETDKNALYRAGGGPSCEHNYTTGLLYHYYFTGNEQAKEAALSLAEWVINMDDGSKAPLSFIDKSHTGLSSSTASYYYNGPGRGAGNSINALIDAYTLTASKRYLMEAEKLIKRCVNPKDDIEKNKLREPEIRWSYTVFLQAIGKYLDKKEELNEKDYMYYYARESLLRYALWMHDNEYVYLKKPEKLEFPTETWAAQEMRKVNVFLFAAKYGKDTERGGFLGKARFFSESSLQILASFKTNFFTRPIAILMACGNMHAYFERYPDEHISYLPYNQDFGLPQRFLPQRVRVLVKLAVISCIFLTGLVFLAILFFYQKFN